MKYYQKYYLLWRTNECPWSFVHSLLTLSRQLCLILKPLILQKFCLYPSSNPIQCALLIRSLDENPELRGMVHHVGLFWKRGDKVVHDRANEILEALPSLKSLYLHASLDEDPFDPRFLEVNPLPHLRKINILDLQLTIENMRRYMVLTHAEHITVRSTFSWGPPQSTNIIQSTSPVLFLDLDSSHHIPPEVLRGVLKWCPRIRKLRCALSGYGFPDPIGGDTLRMHTSLSPRDLSEALASAQDSLRELEFLRCPCKWPGQANSRMNLSMMKVLKSISCPAECFFSPNAVYVARPGLYKLLPASLEELSVIRSQVRIHLV
jgi:hypothetical protein